MKKFKISKRDKRILIAKAIRFTVNSMFFMGILFLVGTLGALEVGAITFVQFFVQSGLCLALSAFAMYAHYKIYEEVTQ